MGLCYQLGAARPCMHELAFPRVKGKGPIIDGHGQLRWRLVYA